MLFKIRGTKNLCKNRGLSDAYGGPDGFRTQCLLLSDFDLTGWGIQL